MTIYDCLLLVTYLCLSGNHGDQIQQKRDQIVKWMKIAFWRVLLKFCSLEMSIMVVETHPDPRIKGAISQHPEGLQGVIYGLDG